MFGTKSRALVVSWIGLWVSACSAAPKDGDASEVARAQQAFSTEGHDKGTIATLRSVKLNPGTPYASELYWYLDERDAVTWVNDPDCFGNDCPSGALAGTCWAFRNPDHFAAHQDLPSWQGANIPAPNPMAWAQSLQPNQGRTILSKWIPRDANQAFDVLVAAAKSVASKAQTPFLQQQFSTKLDGKFPGPTQNRDVREALRLAFDACHYDEDRNACGHVLGNRFCLPDGTQLGAATAECKSFVQTNRWVLSSTPEPGEALSAQQVLDVMTSPTGISDITCGLTAMIQLSALPIWYNDATRYAAAERFIRHRSRGNTLSDGWKNTCQSACTNGECLAGASAEPNGTEGFWTSASNQCRTKLIEVLGALDENPKLLTSRYHAVDQARQCRTVSNQSTCTTLDGWCDSLSKQCKKTIPSPLGLQTVTIGTCNENTSFGGNLLAPCHNENKTLQACATRCTAVQGWVDEDGKCQRASRSPMGSLPYAPGTRDVTPATCPELFPDLNDPSGCTPWSNSNSCYFMGGQCVEWYGTGGGGACVDHTLDPSIPYINQSLNSFGTCTDSVNGGFTSGFLPLCNPQVPIVTSTIHWCSMEGSQCHPNEGSCCPGLICTSPFSMSPAYDGTDVCIEPSGGAGYHWLGLHVGGGGTLQVGGKTCTTDCILPQSAGAPVSVTAILGSGYSGVTFSGCDQSAGTSCVVSMNEARNVVATFSQGAGSQALNVALSGLGSGSVSASGATLACNAGACAGNAVAGSQVTLYATPSAGSLFAGWSGDCSSSGINPCSLSMTSAHTATALFTRVAGSGQIYSDVPAQNPYFAQVNLLQQKGITLGLSTSPPVFGAGQTISRAQAAVFLMRAKNLAQPNATQGFFGGSPDNFTAPTSPYFSDVPASHPMFKAIQKMRELGITSGCGTDAYGQPKYCPDDPLLAYQAAVFTARARYGEAFPQTASPVYFNDVPATNPYFGAVQRMAADGVHCGCGGGSFCTEATIPRDQAAAFVMRTFFGSGLLQCSAAQAFSVLGVSKTGSGSGTVFSSPGGVSCGGTCSAAFPQGTWVQLSAQPNAGSTFGGWSGACGGTGACWVNMSAPAAVGASFEVQCTPNAAAACGNYCGGQWVHDGCQWVQCWSCSSGSCDGVLCQTNQAPIIANIVENYGGWIGGSSWIQIHGSGFSTAVSDTLRNTVQLLRDGYPDVWYYEHADGGPDADFWESPTQINVKLDGLAPGAWRVVVRNASSAPSSEFSMYVY